MGKIVAFDMVTVDGFFEGPDRDISWHNVDQEFNEFAIQQLNSVDLLLFGRITYEMMASYWPGPAAIQDDPVVAKLMNSKPKIVFSRTLDGAVWNNTRLIKTNISRELSELRKKSGKELIIFGSANLTASLADLGLVDEYRIMVNPVILGKGRSLFEGFKQKTIMKLLTVRTFSNGNVLLCYQAGGK